MDRSFCCWRNDRVMFKVQMRNVVITTFKMVQLNVIATFYCRWKSLMLTFGGLIFAKLIEYRGRELNVAKLLNSVVDVTDYNSE